MIVLSRPWVGVFLLSVLTLGSFSRAEEPTPHVTELLGELERSFAGIKTVQTRFQQTKTMKLFSHPVQLAGTILLEPPQRLLWRVERPIRYVFLLDGDKAVEWDEETGKKKKLPLSGNPVFEQILAQIRGWFTGRFSQLMKDYRIQIVTPKPLVLAFAPKEGNRIGKAVREIRVHIREDRRYLQKMVLTEVTGDVTVTDFLDVQIDALIPPEAWEVEPE